MNAGSGAQHWLRNATLADGRTVDVALDGPVIAGVHPVGSAPADAVGEDLTGMLLLPAPAEPHAHLDKVYTSSIVPNPKGDLNGAIAGWIGYLPNLTDDGMVQRATKAALDHLAHGATAIRTHVNVHDGIGLRAAEALLQVRRDIGHLMDIQIVALVGWTSGPNGENNRRFMRSCLELDPSILVGGAPHLDDDPIWASDFALDIAGEFGRDIDLHTDETLDPAHLELRYLAERVLATGYTGTATASHCCSLGMQSPQVQHEVALQVEAANVSVVALPQTNLFLQSRDLPTGPPRGITAVRALLDAGANVAAGADNVRDPFNSMGRSDPFETAALMVMAAHLLPHEAWAAITDGSRRALALPVVRVEAGSPAELVAVPKASLSDAIAASSEHRIVWHHGRVVARTQVTSTIG